MLDLVLIKYIHFISIFGVVGTLLIELFNVKKLMTRKEIKLISRIDLLYGVAAILLVAAGLTMWFYVGKPADFYSRNWIFLTKVGFFVIVGILSIVPTIFFAKNRKGDTDESIEVPSKVINIIRIEVFLIFIIPLLATLMANGIGTF